MKAFLQKILSTFFKIIIRSDFLMFHAGKVKMLLVLYPVVLSWIVGGWLAGMLCVGLHSFCSGMIIKYLEYFLQLTFLYKQYGAAVVDKLKNAIRISVLSLTSTLFALLCCKIDPYWLFSF